MDIDGDDENSDFVANAAEQKVIKGTAENSLFGYRAPRLKKIAACLRPGIRNIEAPCKNSSPSPGVATRARSRPLSRHCPNRPSDEGAASAWTASRVDRPLLHTDLSRLHDLTLFNPILTGSVQISQTVPEARSFLLLSLPQCGRTR